MIITSKVVPDSLSYMVDFSFGFSLSLSLSGGCFRSLVARTSGGRLKEDRNRANGSN